MVKTSRTANWIAAAAVVALTIGLSITALQPVNVMQETATELRKVKAKAEGLAPKPDRFEESPLAGISGAASTVQDVVREEKMTPERLKMLTLNDTAEMVMDKQLWAEAAKRYTVAIDYIASCEKQGIIDKCGSPESVGLLKSTNFASRGFCYMNSKEYNKGVSDLTQAIKYRPYYSINYSNRAKAYRLLGKKELALQDDKKAAELNASGMVPAI